MTPGTESVIRTGPSAILARYQPPAWLAQLLLILAISTALWAAYTALHAPIPKATLAFHTVERPRHVDMWVAGLPADKSYTLFAQRTDCASTADCPVVMIPHVGPPEQVAAGVQAELTLFDGTCRGLTKLCKVVETPSANLRANLAFAKVASELVLPGAAFVLLQLLFALLLLRGYAFQLRDDRPVTTWSTVVPAVLLAATSYGTLWLVSSVGWPA